MLHHQRKYPKLRFPVLILGMTVALASAVLLVR